MLNEVLDPSDLEGESAYNITWKPPLDTNYSEKEYSARFNVDGDDYVVGFTKLNKKNVIDYYMIWDLDRSTQGWWWTIKAIFNGQGIPMTRTTKFKDKGMGYTLRVIKGVFTCIHDFVSAKQPSIIEYDAVDADLKKFYNMVSMKLAPKFGYAAHHNMLVRKESLRRPAIKAIVSKPLTDNDL